MAKKGGFLADDGQSLWDGHSKIHPRNEAIVLIDSCLMFSALLFVAVVVRLFWSRGTFFASGFRASDIESVSAHESSIQMFASGMHEQSCRQTVPAPEPHSEASHVWNSPSGQRVYKN